MLLVYRALVLSKQSIGHDIRLFAVNRFKIASEVKLVLLRFCFASQGSLQEVREEGHAAEPSQCQELPHVGIQRLIN